MTPLPISAFIIARNEADRIGHTIESLRGLVAEIIVVDSGSTDDTVELSKELGAKTLFNEWPGYGPQKRFAEEQCQHDWLLNLDADEALSDELVEEIRRLFANGEPEHSGYFIRICEILPGEVRPTALGHSLSAVRLYDKRCGRYSDSTVHDRVHFERGNTSRLGHVIWHRSSRSLAHSVDKLNHYSSMQAEDMRARKRMPPFFAVRLVLEFPLAFCKAYFRRGYMFKGVPGFVNSMVYAFSRFIRLAKLDEAKRRKP